MNQRHIIVSKPVQGHLVFIELSIACYLTKSTWLWLSVLHGESQGNGRSRCFYQLQENQTNQRSTRTPAPWAINQNTHKMAITAVFSCYTLHWLSLLVFLFNIQVKLWL